MLSDEENKILEQLRQANQQHEQVLGSLSTQLSACVGCHAGYRLEAVAPPVK